MSEKQCAFQDDDSVRCQITFPSKGARKFCTSHMPTKAVKKAKGKKASKSNTLEVVTRDVIQLDVSEAQLDRYWSKLSIGEKGMAIQVVLDSL
jgi:hypothetical protein